MRYALIFILLTAVSFGADMQALNYASNEASAVFEAIVKTARTWILFFLGLIPMIVFILASVQVWRDAKMYLTSREIDVNATLKSPMGMLDFASMAMIKVFGSLLMIFLIYGVFVKVYANPEHTKTFTDAWRLLVTDFWRGML